MESALREEAIRLRVEERKSLNEIHRITGISNWRLHEWLKPYPLTEIEQTVQRREIGLAKRNSKGRQEAIHLRVAERKSLNEIHVITGLSKGSLSVWLRPYPLTPEEKKARHTGKVCLSRRKNRGEMSELCKMAENREFSTLEKGKIAELAVHLRLVLKGFRVYAPLVDGDKVDWMVQDPITGKISKIQVKWASSQNNGAPVISLRCSNGRGKYRLYERGEFDFIVGYDLHSDTAYVFSYNEVERMRSISIREDAKERWDKLLK